MAGRGKQGIFTVPSRRLETGELQGFGEGGGASFIRASVRFLIRTCLIGIRLLTGNVCSIAAKC